MGAGLALTLVLGGCAGLSSEAAGTNPARATGSTQPHGRAIAAELRRAQATHELPSPAPPQHAPGSASPVQAIRRFAKQYVNWSDANVVARMHALARASVGQARAEMTLTAAQVRGDRTLRQAGIANHGTVEAVARVRWRRRYVVVTREWTTARYTTAYQGLAPAWHVTLVTVARVSGAARRGRGPRHWAVSVWQPQS
jgi:hypothetical protein